jgi:predicted permease
MFLYAWIGPIPEDMIWLKKVLIVQAAMPAGIFALVVVQIYDGDRTTAMRSIMASILGCLVSLPLWLILGLRLVEG